MPDNSRCPTCGSPDPRAQPNDTGARTCYDKYHGIISAEYIPSIQDYAKAEYMARDLSNPIPDDEPTEDFAVRDNIAWFKPTETQAKIIEYVIENYEPKARGNYISMVHRETDGPDPLVQEPKDKP